jgi:divalent metal cation (Fe/Co/Zn/Cd) transporter
VALIAVGVAARPPDDNHAYGHEKAEYFSAGAEGALILVAEVTT